MTEDTLKDLARTDPSTKKPPRSSDLMGVVAEIERRFAVFEWQVEGVPIWPLARIRWFSNEFAFHYTSPKSSPPPPSPLERLYQVTAGPVQAACANIKDRSGHDTGTSTRDLVFLSDGLSFARLGTTWLDRFCDPLISLAKHRGLESALWMRLHEFRLPRASPVQLIQPAIDRANIAGALRAIRRVHAVHLPEHESLLQYLRSMNLRTAPLERAKVESDGCRLRSVANLFRRKLNLAEPQVAFVVGYYSVEAMAFILACRECGVLSVDIQHGVQGELHPAYGGWRLAAGRTHTLLPDRFWVWSDWEFAVIERWSHSTGHAAVVGGNPWSRLWEGERHWAGVAEALRNAQTLKGHGDAGLIVLVTLQFGLSDAEQLEPLARLVAEFHGGFRFWIRLHPVMLERREEVRVLLESAGPCEIDAPTDLPLQALLQFANVHLTHSSSAVIEAAEFGVCSIITSHFGEELFSPLYEAGWIETETGNIRQLAAALRRAAANRKPRDRVRANSIAEGALDGLLTSSKQSRPVGDPP